MEYDTMRPSLQDLVFHSLSELVAKLLLISEVMSDLDFGVTLRYRRLCLGTY